MYSEKWGRIACVLYFIGFNMTFLTQFFLGSKGMPRRYYNYLDQFQPLHAFSTFGSWVLGLSLFMTAAYLLASLRKPMDAPDNPWGGTTLEWQTAPRRRSCTISRSNRWWSASPMITVR